MLKLLDDFVFQMQQMLANEADEFFSSLYVLPKTSVRLNAEKFCDLICSENVEWSANGKFLSERPLFTLDPLFHAGAYYVQESSSMFLEEIIQQLNIANSSLRVLDLCAAPGGKSTHLLSLLQSDSLLVSNEVIKSRVKTLEENLVKWGYNNYIITNNEAEDFTSVENYFDVIVCDAPCSGEGMFRKDAEAMSHWSHEAVLFCSQRQKKIIADVLPALKPNGYFIYSTCTFNTEENEKIVRWMMDELRLNTITIDLKKFPEVVVNENTNTLRFYPHKVKGEGFAITVLQKPTADFIPLTARHHKLKEVKTKDVLKSPTDFYFYETKNSIHVINKSHVNDVGLLSDKLNVVKAGTEIFVLKGKDKIPSHELAMSINLDSSCFKTIELDKHSALKYLKGETQFGFDGDAGFYLATYKKQPLGFLKKISNRFNNLYPRHLFIRMNIDEALRK
ncbi:MAG: methyltransferase domain-containing protein [Bacteroidetes bacterium]|nr:methyltransferase domain-containing protein [Bacteroidota bacterium]